LKAAQEGNMMAKQFVILSAFVLTSSLCGSILAQEMQSAFVRIAEPEIDPAPLERLGRPHGEAGYLTEKGRNNAGRSR
jgi:hypothetical protein